MIFNLKTNKWIWVISFACMVLGISFIPNLWFKWSLGKTHNIPDTEVPTQDSNRLCLIFALDGVPFEVIKDLTDEGYFKGFYPPGRLISTFPSLTRPSFSKLLIGGKPFGYERLYFDHRENKIKGFHLAQKIFKAKADAPDYHPKLHFLGFPGYIAYVFPDQFTQTAMDTFKEKLLEFKGNEFIAYMGFSDAIAHVYGKDGQIEFLKRISQLLDEVRNELGLTLDIVLFSDHGNNFKPNQRVDLAGELKKKGFNDASRLTLPNDFVLLRNGFVSIAAIYTMPEAASTLADALSSVEGVDFSTYISGNSIMVHGAEGIAKIDKYQSLYRYIPVSGDPLQLKPTIESLARHKDVTSSGFIDSEIFWQNTQNHIYPDPLDRIWQAHHTLVQYPATLIISFKDGYAFGPAIFDNSIIAGRKSTHGALLYNHSCGFFMTDFKAVNPYNRPEKVVTLLAHSAEVKTAGKKLWPFRAMEWFKK